MPVSRLLPKLRCLRQVRSVAGMLDHSNETCYQGENISLIVIVLLRPQPVVSAGGSVVRPLDS